MNIVKNDTVLVLTGKDKGKTGRVLAVFPKEERVIVEGVNFIYRHTRPSQKNPQGGRVEKEAPIHVSNTMVICGKCSKPTRVGYKILANGEKERYCKKCDEIIPRNAR